MKYLAIILILICTNVAAGGNHYEPPKPEAVSNSESKSTASAAAIAGAASQSVATVGDVAVNVDSSSNNSNMGNSNVVNNQSVDLGGAVTVEGSTWNQAPISNQLLINDFDFPVFQGTTSTVTICDRSIPVSNLSLGVSSTLVRNKVAHSGGLTFTMPLGVDSGRLIRSAENCEQMREKNAASQLLIQEREAEARIRKLNEEIRQLENQRESFK